MEDREESKRGRKVTAERKWKRLLKTGGGQRTVNGEKDREKKEMCIS